MAQQGIAARASFLKVLPSFPLEPNSYLALLHHCRVGTVGWHLSSGQYIYTPGLLHLHLLRRRHRHPLRNNTWMQVH